MPWILVKKNLIQLSTILIIVASVLTLGLMDTQTSAQTKSSLNAEIESIQNRVNQINASLEDVTQLKDSFQEEVARVESEIAETNNLITDTDTAITGLEEEIARNNEQIIKLQEDITTLTKQIQANNHISPLQNLLSSRDVGEAIGKMFTLSNTQSELDEKRMELEDLNAQKEANLTTQKELKEQLESTKIILESKKQSLDSLIATYRGRESEYARQIAELKEQESANQSQIEALEAQEQRAREEAARRSRQNTGGGNSGGGAVNLPPGNNQGNAGPLGCSFEYNGNINFPQGYFIKPVNRSIGLNGGFGCPIPEPYGNGTRYHDAIDLTAPHDTPVGASAPGTVVTVRTGCAPYYPSACGSGYGNHIVIKHDYNGESLYTLYAHLAFVSVSNGQNVSRGQQIGGVGRSGRTSGPHVHFMMMPGATYGGPGCRIGGASKCLRPERFVGF